jgi:hypothetical protein
MLQNNLDPEVAENPEHLVVYGGTGRAARSWDDVRSILGTLATMREDETLCVQSGRPVAVWRTHEDAPRVLISNSQIVPHWANWDEFRRLEAIGLTMFGQMTAGSWIYIGTQGILQGTYETFAACGRSHFNGDLSHRLVVSGGLGGMGGAQPLAACMAGATFLGADVDLGSAGAVTGAAGRPDLALFGEAPTRVIATCAPDKLAELEAVLGDLPHHTAGRVAGSDLRCTIDAKELFAVPVSELHSAYESLPQRLA